ncbi:MAG: hypothetical protein DSM106950_39425 [Stigonema ocellatum SAG 48.90 = DSM 106950]|nr:hypothetical protein [Stigonema ocellatum SAG 48.90 = DSM 106950]
MSNFRHLSFFQETREWGVGSGEWGKRGSGGVCFIHRGWFATRGVLLRGEAAR